VTGTSLISPLDSDREAPRFSSHITVELVRADAADEHVLFAARVSTQGELTREARGEADVQTTPRDRGLINFLMRDRHGSPFEHNSMTFYVHAPLFVMREFMRHRTASYNEESGRYRRMGPLFYLPGRERNLLQTGKPGAYEYLPGTDDQHSVVDAATRTANLAAFKAYEDMLHAGIAREVARGVLPLNLFSSMYVTFNARALMNFVSLRTRTPDAAFPSFPQREIEMVAEQIEAEWARLMPVTHAAFVANGRVAP